MNNENPLVSILIPVYNREKYIGEAIESAINQTYKNIEVIIVDNCSTDNTWKILQDYQCKDKRIHIFQNEKNLGPVYNWIECFKRAKGVYSKILWSDDWMSLDFVENALSAFNEDISFVISAQQIITNDKEILSNVAYLKDRYSQREYLENALLYNKYNFPLSPGCAIFRTKDVLNNFIVDIPNSDSLDSKKNGAGNDLYLFLKIALHYPYIGVVANSVSYFRAHKESFSVASDLNLYYEWAKVDFINSELRDSYFISAQTMLLFKFSVKNKHFRNICKSLSYNKYILQAVFRLLLIRV